MRSDSNKELIVCIPNRYTVHLGYSDVSFPQSQTALRKLPLYPREFTKTTGKIDSIGSNRNTLKILLYPKSAHLDYGDVWFPQSQIAVSKLSLYSERFTNGTGKIDSIGSNRIEEDIVVSGGPYSFYQVQTLNSTPEIQEKRWQRTESIHGPRVSDQKIFNLV